MNSRINRRVINEALYILDTKSTIRETAKIYNVSKSTVHKDVTERLEVINPRLAEEIRKVLDVNKAERHLRGGMATRDKYSHMRK